MERLKKLSWKELFIFLILSAAGAGVNMTHPGFGLGLSFFPGAVFYLLAFMLLPMPLPLLGALLINLPLWGSWHFVLFTGLALLELLYLWAVRRKGIRNLVGADGFFWLLAGLPVTFAVAHWYFGFDAGLSFAFFSGLAINGLGCITMASVLYFGWSFIATRITKGKDRHVFPIGSILFNMVALGILTLTLLFYALDNGRFIARYTDEIGTVLEEDAERLIRLYEGSFQAGETSFPIGSTLRPAAYIAPDEPVLRNEAAQESPLKDNTFLWETVRSEKTLFLFSGNTGGAPLPWMNHYVVYRTGIDRPIRSDLIISYALHPHEERLIRHHVLTLTLSLVILYGAFLLALFLTPLLAGPIVELTHIAEALSREQMIGMGAIQWPSSTVEEIQDLVDYSQKSYGNMIERNVQLTSLNRSLEYSAYYDGLTKLPNRTLFIGRLEEMISYDSGFALVFLDLDGFKMLNDSYGHRAGDVLLTEFAYRLSNLGGDVFAARLGGDEFALIISEEGEREQIVSRMDTLMDKLARPIDVEGELHVVHSSIGLALYPEHGLSVSALLRNADLAMYKVKSKGKNNWQIYNEELDNALTQYEMELGIYKAFEENQFDLFYQPQVDIRTGDIISLEALIRWNHPEKGFISPSLFIPLAERMDIMIPIGYWVIEEAAKKGKALVERGFKGVVSVNVSPRQFSETNFFQATIEILERIGLAPEHFGIEVTETMVMGNVSFTSKIISQFMKYGVHVSIDDFGTGYTSLSLLQDLNVHTLKIDQAFVEKVGQSRKNEIVLNNIINLTRELEMDIVIEGVETEEQNSFFRDRACYTSQGFLYHKPLPYNELQEVLRKSSDFT